MTAAYPVNPTGGASRDHGDASAALGVAKFLSLAATPTLATMALLTGAVGEGPMDMLGMPAGDASPLSGMVAMYLLMSVFHSAPWLKLISNRRMGAHSRGSAEETLTPRPLGVLAVARRHLSRVLFFGSNKSRSETMRKL